MARILSCLLVLSCIVARAEAQTAASLQVSLQQLRLAVLTGEPQDLERCLHPDMPAACREALKLWQASIKNGPLIQEVDFELGEPDAAEPARFPLRLRLDFGFNGPPVRCELTCTTRWACAGTSWKLLETDLPESCAPLPASERAALASSLDSLALAIVSAQPAQMARWLDPSMPGSLRAHALGTWMPPAGTRTSFIEIALDSTHMVLDMEGRVVAMLVTGWGSATFSVVQDSAALGLFRYQGNARSSSSVRGILSFWSLRRTADGRYLLSFADSSDVPQFYSEASPLNAIAQEMLDEQLRQSLPAVPDATTVWYSLAAVLAVLLLLGVLLGLWLRVRRRRAA